MYWISFLSLNKAEGALCVLLECKCSLSEFQFESQYLVAFYFELEWQWVSDTPEHILSCFTKSLIVNLHELIMWCPHNL